jgi:photosystem II oxygen-evolving enhancer protein 2
MPRRLQTFAIPLASPRRPSPARGRSSTSTCAMAFVAATALRPRVPLLRQQSPPVAPVTPCMAASSLAVTRRAVLAAGAGLAAAVAVCPSAPAPVLAADLMPYKDIAKGFSVLRPSGWNEFDGAEGQYDIKWQDVIQPLEFVTVLTTPVSKGKALVDIGGVDSVAERLAKGRGGSVVAAVETMVGGDTPAYVIEIKKEAAHQMTLLAVAKSKLYSLNVSASEQRWPRRQKLLRQVVESFQPKL